MISYLIGSALGKAHKPHSGIDLFFRQRKCDYCNTVTKSCQELTKRYQVSRAPLSLCTILPSQLFFIGFQDFLLPEVGITIILGIRTVNPFHLLRYRRFRKQITPETHTLPFSAARVAGINRMVFCQGISWCDWPWGTAIQSVGLRERKRVCLGGWASSNPIARHGAEAVVLGVGWIISVWDSGGPKVLGDARAYARCGGGLLATLDHLERSSALDIWWQFYHFPSFSWPKFMEPFCERLTQFTFLYNFGRFH